MIFSNNQPFIIQRVTSIQVKEVVVISSLNGILIFLAIFKQEIGNQTIKNSKSDTPWYFFEHFARTYPILPYALLYFESIAIAFSQSFIASV